MWDNVIGKKPTDNIFTSRWLFYALGEKGFRESADGGKTFEFTLETAENTTHHSMGELDTLDQTRIDTFDAAQFSPKITAGVVVYSELERLRAQANSGKFDLLAEKLENAKDSHIASLNRQAWSDGTGNLSKDIGGLQFLISSTPTTGTVGGINRATFAFWRNQQAAGTKAVNAFDNLRSTMRSVYNSCSRGAFEEQPTGWCTTQTVFQGYESLLTTNERFVAADKKKSGSGDAGFANQALMFKGAPGAYDEDCPTGNLYFINNRNLKWEYYQGGWMKMYPEVDPSNQLANIHKLATFSNLCTNASRRLGVVSGIT